MRLRLGDRRFGRFRRLSAEAVNSSSNARSARSVTLARADSLHSSREVQRPLRHARTPQRGRMASISQDES